MLISWAVKRSRNYGIDAVCVYVCVCVCPSAMTLKWNSIVFNINIDECEI